MFTTPISPVSRSAKTVDSSRRAIRRWRIAWIAALGVAVAIFVFAVFLVGTFPYRETAATLLAPYQMTLKFNQQRLSFPIGVRLEDVQLIANDGSHRILLQSPAVRVAPTLGSILFGTPGFQLDAQLFSGDINAVIHQEKDLVRIDFRADSLDLAQSPTLRQFGARASGSLSATGSAEIHGPEVIANRGAGAFAGDGVKIIVTEGFPRISLGSLRGRFVLDDGTLSLQQVETHGGDFEAQLDGTVQLANELDQSTIAARLYLTPTASGLDHFGVLMNMLPHPPSEGPFYLHGSISSPSIS